MADLIDHLGQMAEEIRDGETLVMHLRHLKKEAGVSQEEVNDTLSEVEYLRRLFTTRRLRAEATIAGVVIQDVPETPRERAFREKLRRNGNESE
jgi:hypothetical protein